MSDSERETQQENVKGSEASKKSVSQDSVEASEVKPVSRRPAKRRATARKQTARKADRKAAADDSDRAEGAKAEKDERKVVSRRLAKRRTTARKQTARKAGAGASKTEVDGKAQEVQREAAPEAEAKEKPVGGGPGAEGRAPGTEASRAMVEAEAPGVEAEDRPGEPSPEPEEKRTGAEASKAGKVGPSPPAEAEKGEAASAEAGTAPVEAPKPAASEPPSPPAREAAQAESSRGEQAQESRRSSRRRSSRRRRSGSRSSGENGGRQGGDTRQQESNAKRDSGRQPRTLTEVLAETWTENKARQFVSEGFIANLAPPIVSTGEDESLRDMDALQAPLQMIRKNLASECMVEDDATDVMLLDMVMNALTDRIEVYRLQAEDGQWEDIDQILELRYKADRRLIETINALKNA